MTEAVRRALDALEELKLEPKYDEESGYYYFSYKAEGMVLITDRDEGGVCIGAEFVMDSPYLKPIQDLWVDAINKDDEGRRQGGLSQCVESNERVGDRLGRTATG